MHSLSLPCIPVCFHSSLNQHFYIYTLKEETFASGKIREIFGRNFREFRELANFLVFRENNLSRIYALNYFFSRFLLLLGA